MIGKADTEESKSTVALNARVPQASYPCGNFSDTLFKMFLVKFSVLSQIKPRTPSLVVPFRQFL